MLRDLKTQDMETGKQVIANAQAVAGLNPSNPEFLDSLDQRKLFMASIEPSGKTEEDVFKSQTSQSQLSKQMADSVKELENIGSNVQPPAAPSMAANQSSPPGSAGSGLAGETGRPDQGNPALAALARP